MTVLAVLCLEALLLAVGIADGLLQLARRNEAMRRVVYGDGPAPWHPGICIRQARTRWWSDEAFELEEAA